METQEQKGQVWTHLLTKEGNFYLSRYLIIKWFPGIKKKAPGIYKKIWTTTTTTTCFHQTKQSLLKMVGPPGTAFPRHCSLSERFPVARRTAFPSSLACPLPSASCSLSLVSFSYLLLIPSHVSPTSLSIPDSDLASLCYEHPKEEPTIPNVRWQKESEDPYAPGRCTENQIMLLRGIICGNLPIKTYLSHWVMNLTRTQQVKPELSPPQVTQFPSTL